MIIIAVGNKREHKEVKKQNIISGLPFDATKRDNDERQRKKRVPHKRNNQW